MLHKCCGMVRTISSHPSCWMFEGWPENPRTTKIHLSVLMQDYSYSNALAIELLQSCTNPFISSARDCRCSEQIWNSCWLSFQQMTVMWTHQTPVTHLLWPASGLLYGVFLYGGLWELSSSCWPICKPRKMKLLLPITLWQTLIDRHY